MEKTVDFAGRGFLFSEEPLVQMGLTAEWVTCDFYWSEVALDQVSMPASGGIFTISQGNSHADLPVPYDPRQVYTHAENQTRMLKDPIIRASIGCRNARVACIRVLTSILGYAVSQACWWSS